MHLTFLVPASPATSGGGTKFNRRIIEGLRAANHTVDVVALPGRHPLADEVAAAAACRAWYELPSGTLPVIDGVALGALVPIAGRIEARPTVALVHHPTALEASYQGGERERLRAAERRLFPTMSRLVVTNAPTAERLTKDYGVGQNRIAVVVPGVEEAPRSVGSGRSGCAILSVGALVPRKGHDVLVRALARLPDLDWSLTIVGSSERHPAHAAALDALVHELGLGERVRLAGSLTDEALEDYWQRSDLFALATQWEGYGMAIAEALRRGLPVAVTDGGAAGALVPIEAGVVCAPGDQEGLSKAMRRMIFDRPLRLHAAEAAWQAGRSLPGWPQQAQLFADALSAASRP